MRTQGMSGVVGRRVVVAAMCLALAATIAAADAAAPIHRMGEDAVIREWVVIGPFPNPEAPAEADDPVRTGFAVDHLAALGGEATAELAPGVEVETTDASGASITVRAKVVHAGENGVVDLAGIYPDREFAVAYAFAWVEATEACETTCYFGSDDWPRVWVNGEMVHEIVAPSGRGCAPGQDQFPVSLRAGRNAVMLKIDQNTGPWAFIAELPTPDQLADRRKEQLRRRGVQALQNAQVGPGGYKGYIISPGAFPTLEWENPYLIEAVKGQVDLKVRWFDADLNEVTRADAPGRYAAYVEGVAEDGSVIRRAYTFVCLPEGIEWWNHFPRPEFDYVPQDAITPEAWAAYAGELSETTGWRLYDALQEDGPMVLAKMLEWTPGDDVDTQLNWALTAHQDYHLALKRKVLGISDDAYPSLRPPHDKAGDPATVLRPGAPHEAGMKADAPERIRAACHAWEEQSQIGFTVLVARHGVVVFHEAFGERDGETLTVDSKLPLASLTKMHAGLLFAQFLDQGLIGLDDPVGKYLPDFPTEGDDVVTIRQCLTHATGLDGHGNWGGMANPWFDNAVVNGLELLQPGLTVLYNGLGFDLVGKVMEIVSGKSIFRLFHESFFTPLGQDDPTIVDLGYGIDCTVADLARVGQLTLNRGAYGEIEFFTPATFEQLMPKRYCDMFPGLPDNKDEYGLGISWMREAHPNAGEDGIAEDATVLSKNTIAHGAATSAALRVDLDNDLVVAICRYTGGPDYGEHLTNVLMAVAESLE